MIRRAAWAGVTAAILSTGANAAVWSSETLDGIHAAYQQLNSTVTSRTNAAANRLQSIYQNRIIKIALAMKYKNLAIDSIVAIDKTDYLSTDAHRYETQREKKLKSILIDTAGAVAEKRTGTVK